MKKLSYFSLTCLIFFASCSLDEISIEEPTKDEMRNAYINFSDEEIDNLDYDLVKLIFEDSQVFSDVEKEQLILERAKKIKTSASVGQLEEFLSGFREATENSIYNKDFSKEAMEYTENFSKKLEKKLMKTK